MAAVKRGGKIGGLDFYHIFKDLLDMIEKYGGDAFKFTTAQYKQLRLRFHGKSIAVIGPKASGKSSLISILLTPNINIDTTKYTPTQGKVPLESVNIRYKIPIIKDNSRHEIRFKLRKPHDVGGEIDYRESDWASICSETDFIFYLFDSLEYSTSDQMRKRVEEDLTWIAENNQLFSQNFKIVVFANKIDLLGNAEAAGKWADQNIPNIEELAMNKLGVFKHHLSLIAPMSLRNKSERVRSIGDALLKVAG